MRCSRGKKAGCCSFCRPSYSPAAPQLLQLPLQLLQPLLQLLQPLLCYSSNCSVCCSSCCSHSRSSCCYCPAPASDTAPAAAPSAAPTAAPAPALATAKLPPQHLPQRRDCLKRRAWQCARGLASVPPKRRSPVFTYKFSREGWQIKVYRANIITSSIIWSLRCVEKDDV